MAGVKGRSGGQRPGAGRPRHIKTVSDKVKGNYTRAANKLKREFGMSFEEAMLRLAFDPKTQDSVRASVMKSYNEAMISRQTEQNITVSKSQGMDIKKAVRLPPKQQDPALKVVKG